MISAGRLIALRAAIIADLKVFLPSIKTIEPHLGPFDIDELKTFSVAAPAIKVTLLGWQPSEEVSTRELDCHAHLAAYIVTKPQPQMKADEVALDIAEALAGRVTKKSYTAYSETGKQVACTNHYSGSVRETGAIALFSVDWKCVVRIGTSAPAARYVDTGAPPGTVIDPLVALNGGGFNPITGDPL